MDPLHSEQSTWVAEPMASPTPLFPKNAAEAPLSLQRSKLTLAPTEFVPERPFWAHNGLPWAGQRLLTMTTMEVPALESLLPDESVCPVSFQQVPQAGPAPAPGPTPKRFWLAAALKPGSVKNAQAAVLVLQLGDPKLSPAP